MEIARAAFRRFTKFNFPRFAEFSHAVYMAEKIHGEKIAACQRGKQGRPDFRRFFSSHRLATLGSQQLESNCLHIRAEIQRLHVQRKRRKFERAASRCRVARCAHSSSSDGNFF